MRHVRLSLLLSVLGCATAQQAPPKWLTDAQGAVQAAQAAGADQVPAAQEALAKANQALAKATASKDAMQGTLATAQADLATNLAKEAKAKANLQAAMNTLNALKAQ
jgi:hypothetical protein